MTDILTITLNPALDVATSCDALQPSHKLRCAHAERFPGGGGINVARVVQRLGGDCLALYLAGGVVGDRLQNLLQAEQVPSHRLGIADETRESFSVLETSSGREYRFVLPGPDVTAREWQACVDFLAAVEPAPRYVVLSGSLPPTLAVDSYAQLATLARSRGLQGGAGQLGNTAGSGADRRRASDQTQLARVVGADGWANGERNPVAHRGRVIDPQWEREVGRTEPWRTRRNVVQRSGGVAGGRFEGGGEKHNRGGRQFSGGDGVGDEPGHGVAGGVSLWRGGGIGGVVAWGDNPVPRR